MIVCESLEKDFQVRFSDGERSAVSDTTPDHGGSGEGFRPHDLLEAALGNCIAIISRMYAKTHGIALEGVTVRVNLDRQDPAKAVFEYSVEYKGNLDTESIEKLKRAVKACPVHKTLGRQLEFREV
jgi:putative redox protein